MAQSWHAVRVFISSTFRDMHAERDHLVRVVFPELKERCRKRHVNLIDVDLRWGVTEEQAVGSGALDICLDEIDSCRPYFLGLLGHRYGYIPPGQDHSITAEEIYHGVLHNNLPRQLIDLRPFVEGILEGRTLFKEQVNCLVRCYLWNLEKRKYLLQQGISPEDEKILRSIFDVYSIYQRDRSFFFFRAESLTREMAGSNINDHFEVDEAIKGKLAQFKQEIIAAGLPYFEYNNLETFGQKVLETLWGRIDVEFPEKREEIESDWLKEETEFHELFIADRTRRFVGRSEILRRMHTFAEDGSDPSLMVIMGEPGCGKSALIARFTEDVIHNHPDWVVLSHFVGASASSTSLRRMLRRLCTQLNRALGVEGEAPEEYKELAQLFPELLQKASQTRRVLLVIDALNQLERTDNAHTMRWLPQKLADNVKVVVSTLAVETLDALKTWRVQPRFEELTGLTEPEIKEFVTSYLGEIRKEFPTKRVQETFYDRIKGGNPLYILVALEELRVFPVYEEVGRRVASLPDTVPELFDQVLERIESDFSQPLVQDFMSLIACGLQGMTGEELQTLLKKHAPVVDPDTPPAKLPDMLFSRVRRAFTAYLFERSGVIDFFHGQLKEAVGKRYLAEETDRDKVHQIIAGYFEKRWMEPYNRALDELPHQLTKAKDWEGIERVLCDLYFIEFKCAAGMTYELIRDYNVALDELPEAQPEKRERLKHEALLKKYTEDLVAYAKGEIQTLEIIPSVEPWSEKRIKQDKERIINKPTRLDRTRAFSQFVNSESHGLVKFASHSGFCVQQAYNFANSGPIAVAADSIHNNIGSVLIMRVPSQRPEFNPHLALLRTLEGHTSKVTCVSVMPDGKKAVSGSDDATLRVWNLENGECLNKFDGHIGEISSISVTPDGKMAVSGGRDAMLRVWDLKSGECVKILKGHTNRISSVSITPDGKRTITASSDNTLRVWNLDAGECLRIIDRGQADENIGGVVGITSGGNLAISASRTLGLWDLETGKLIKKLKGISSWSDASICYDIRVTPDGKVAISGHYDNTLRVWDLKSGECVKILKGHTKWINSVSITPDGKRAVSGSDDATLRVWNLENGECLSEFDGHTGGVSSISATPDGKIAVSGGSDHTLRVWSLDSGVCLKVQKHNQRVSSLTSTADGQMAVSTSFDKTVRVWDLNSGYCLSTLKGHKDIVLSASVTPDGKKAVSSGWGRMCLWDIDTRTSLRTFKGHRGFWGIVDMVYITPDGKRAVSAGDDKTLRLWDLNNGKCLRTLKGHKDMIRSMSLTLDGKKAISTSFDKTLRVWDLNNGDCVRTLKANEGWIYAMDVAPDGKAVFSGNADKSLRVWSLESGECLRTIEGHTKWTEKVSITLDWKRAISGSGDQTLRVWDLINGNCLRVFGGHKDMVRSVIMTPDAKTVLSASDNDSLRLWDLDTGQCLAVYCHGYNFDVTLRKTTASGHFALGTDIGEVIILNLYNLHIGPLIVTPVRIWLYGGKGNGGCWDDRITTVCQWCGQRFPVSDIILNVIRAINRNVNLSPNQLPYLELPGEAWEDPKLLSECPLCHKLLKFNPFIVDNRGRY